MRTSCHTYRHAHTSTSPATPPINGTPTRVIPSSPHKELVVAQLNRKKANELAAANIEKGKAEAEINRLKVNAGLTPQERAEFEVKRDIGVAAELAKTKFPEVMIFGGSNGNGLNPFDALGLKAMKEMIGNKR